MQAFASWLVARPQNAVLGLVATLLLAALQLVSIAIMVLLVLAEGPRRAGILAAIAAAVLLTVSLIFGESIAAVVAVIVLAWGPAVVLAMLLLNARSLTLTLQVSVIIAVLAMIGFYVVVSDPVAFWQTQLTAMAEIVRQNNLPLKAELPPAEVMTVFAVLAFWLLYVAGLLLGYALYKRLPRETGEFGRFRDLNFGKVIAFTMALMSMLAFVTGASWLQNLAFVMFVLFWLQGLAIVHWLHGEGRLPLAALVAVYALLPLLNILLMTALAVFGYTDAWFDFRRRMKKA